MQTIAIALVTALVFGIVFAVVAGLPIMWLWNALMPELFNMPSIGFWQAIGLAFLGRLLFGGGSSSTSKS